MKRAAETSPSLKAGRDPQSKAACRCETQYACPQHQPGIYPFHNAKHAKPSGVNYA